MKQLNNDTRNHDFDPSSNRAKLDDDLVYQTPREGDLHPNNISGSNPREDESFRSETLGEAYNVTPNDSMLENSLKSQATEDVTSKPPKSRVTEDVTPKTSSNRVCNTGRFDHEVLPKLPSKSGEQQ